jgi:uncharacterized protein (TIGR02145 family)
MKKITLSYFVFLFFILTVESFSQSKIFCASDISGKKYELNLTEGSGIITAKTYSNSGVLLGSLSGTWSMQDGGIYGSAYFVTAVFTNGSMKFSVIRDATGNIEKLQDVVAGRQFYSCDSSESGIINSNNDGSKYSWNQEKKLVNGKISIGSQIWSGENLSITKFRNGDLIPEAKTNEEWSKYYNEGKPAWCYYENNPVNDVKYGKLYNWYAFNDPRGLAPLGWSIPTSDDWKKLTDGLGGESAYSRDGNAMKSRGEWAESAISNEAKFSNSSGFSAMPAGFRNNNGAFQGLNYYGVWWKAGGTNIGIAYNNHSTSLFDFLSKQAGLSVRLIKDNNFNQNSELSFVLVKAGNKSELKLFTDATNSATFKVYNNGIVNYTINGNWKIEQTPSGQENIIFTFMKRTSGGFESSSGVYKYVFICQYDTSKNRISHLYESGTPDDYWFNVSVNQNPSDIVKNVVQERIYDKSKVIGNSIRIGNLEIAENDFESEMDFKEALEASSRLGDGWRLPTLDELKIIDDNKDKIRGLKYDKNYYWSSNTTNLGEAKVYYYSFNYHGKIGYRDRYSHPCVRPVRSLMSSN